MDLSASMEDKYINTRHKLLICVALGCNNNSVTCSNVQFHQFPASHLGKIWQSALGIRLTPNSSTSAVCSKHFRDEDYVERLYFEGDVEKIHRTLKEHAVPCTFSPLQQTLKDHDVSYTFPSFKCGNKPFRDGDYTEITSPEVENPYKPREKTLVLLTRKFMDIMKSCPYGLLDINSAVEELKISRRRMYDITNVLEGIGLLKKRSARWVQWAGPQYRLGCLVSAEKRLDDLITLAKQQIITMYENFLNNRYAYVTYDDIHKIPIFQDQAVFLIKAPQETVLQVAHPSEAFQLHIVSKTGPVKVLGCTDTLDATQNKRKKIANGDYWNLPLRGLSKAATSRTDNANHNTQTGNVSNSPSEPTQPLSQDPNTLKCSESVLPPHQDHLNSSPPVLPLSTCVKEELDELNVTPDEPLNESVAPVHVEVSSDVHMMDLS